MGYEVDFLGTDSESNSADAIAIRFGNLHGPREEQTVVIIDGGFTEDGAKLVQHVKEHFTTDRVDIVISTHPDQDHINGLEAVLTDLTVGELWMHLPWAHNFGLANKFHDGRVTDSSIGERLKASLNKAHVLWELALAHEIPVKEPFTGLLDASGGVRVLGPSQEYYETLIPQFDGMPAARSRSALEGLLGRAAAAVKSFFAQWGEDEIDDSGVTSAKNNSSVITQIIVDDRRLVFTGDAGIGALHHAADQIDVCNHPAELRFIQVPHHGSRRNVGPSVLDRMIGAPVTQGTFRGITAVASTAKQGEPKHPRKSVLNAFTHRGVKVLATRGSGVCHTFGAPDRAGWTSIEAEPYHWDLDEEA